VHSLGVYKVIEQHVLCLLRISPPDLVRIVEDVLGFTEKDL
jgi:hypothetical protein